MPGEDVYDDEHRIFLQGLMSKGILSFKVSYLKSVLRSRSRLEPVLFGRSPSRCKDVKAKNRFFNYFLAYFYMKRSRSR